MFGLGLPYERTATPRQAPVAWMVRLTSDGLICGADAVLARMVEQGRLDLDADRDRLLALLSIAADEPVDAQRVMPAIEAAAKFWQRGDKALANLRLVFASLPRPTDIDLVQRLSLAAKALSDGMSPMALLRARWPESFGDLTRRYDPDEPRVPAGHGVESGRWTFADVGENARAKDRPIRIAEEDETEPVDLPFPRHESVTHDATASVVPDHHRLHVLDPLSHLPTGIARPAAVRAVMDAAKDALTAVGPGKGPVYGTAVHERMKNGIKALNIGTIRSEVSYLHGRRVLYGTKGSIRIDSVLGHEDRPDVLIDLKTGSASLDQRRVDQIRSHVPTASRNAQLSS